MNDHNSKNNYEAQTLILNDSSGNELFCYLEQIVKVKEIGVRFPLKIELIGG